MIMKWRANYTYLTVLNSQDYLKGTLALDYMLKENNSKYPLTVLITDDIGTNAIQVLNDNNINYLKIPSISVEVSNSKDLLYWKNTFNKLFVFGITEFDKIVFLDSDMFIKKNIDELFKNDNLAAVSAGKNFPGNSSWIDLNSGIMVIVPRKGEDKKLFRIMNKMLKSKNIFNIGDQDVLHLAYPNWSEDKHLHLGEEYNVFSSYEAYYLNKGIIKKPIKIIHYVGKNKPWNMSNLECIRYCVRVTLSLLKRTHSTKGSRVFISDFRKYRKLCMSFDKLYS